MPTSHLTLRIAAALSVVVVLPACTHDLGRVIVAEADLAERERSGVKGRIKFLHGDGYPDDISAYVEDVVLPDALPRRAVVYDATSCDVDPATAVALDPPPAATPPERPDGDLGVVRLDLHGEPAFYEYVPEWGDLFIENALVGEIELDAKAPGTAIGKIAVVQSEGPTGQAVRWLACGPIRAVSRRE